MNTGIQKFIELSESAPIVQQPNLSYAKNLAQKVKEYVEVEEIDLNVAALMMHGDVSTRTAVGAELCRGFDAAVNTARLKLVEMRLNDPNTKKMIRTLRDWEIL